MKDKFGNYLMEGDFVIYNQCVVGKVVSPNEIVVSSINFAQLKYANLNNLYGPSLKTRLGVAVRNQRGQRTVITNFNKIIKMAGLPSEVKAKFK